MKKLLLILMMVTFAGVNTANANWVLGIGTRSCENFLDDINSNEVVADGITSGKLHEALYQMWTLGFVSGTNIANEYEAGKDFDPNAIYDLVKKTCKNKPTDITDYYGIVSWVYHNHLMSFEEILEEATK